MAEAKKTIGFIPMDLEEDLRIAGKWGGANIKEIIGFLSAMVDSKLTDKDLITPPTKTGTQYEKQKDKKTKEIWKIIEPKYKGTLVGNRYYSIVSHLVDGQTRFNKNILKRYKPYRKNQ
jgi:beta-mannanase